MQRVITETESDITSRPTTCDTTLQHSTAEDASAGAENWSTSFLAATNDEAQGRSKTHTDLDYLDGPAIITEVCLYLLRSHINSLNRQQQPSEPYKTEYTGATPIVSEFLTTALVPMHSDKIYSP